MASDQYHEPVEELTPQTRDMHRALVSLQEEIEAIDWYRQRADACGDEEMKAVLLHNMREEMEHACMMLEWLRRHSTDFDANLRTYLFTEGPVLDVEKVDTGKQSVENRDSITKFTIGTLKE